MLVQIDGSRHDWLEKREPRLTLLAGIDCEILSAVSRF